MGPTDALSNSHFLWFPCDLVVLKLNSPSLAQSISFSWQQPAVLYPWCSSCSYVL